MKLLSITIFSIVLLISGCSEAPDTQGQAESKAASVAEASKPATVAEASKPATVAEGSDSIAMTEAFKATIELMIAEDDVNAEKCIIDPVTGKKVCKTGFCWAFGGLCEVFPFSVMQIPPGHMLSNAKLVGSAVLDVAKAGLETTETGTAIVKKATNIMYRIKRAFNALLTDPLEVYDTFEKTTSIDTQAINKPKVINQGAN